MEFIIITLASIGCAISLHIFHHKRNNKDVLCILGGKCNEVIYSKYSRTFSIPNELLGITYYLSVILAIMLKLYTPIFTHSLTFSILLTGALLAASFSIYLTLVQVLALKKICRLCLVTNVINVIIFVAIARELLH